MDAAEALAVFPDGSLLLGGKQEDCIQLMRFNPSGALLWSRHICAFDPKRDVIGSPVQLIPDPANPGGFWLVFRKSALSGSPENLLDLLKFDADGNVLWETQLRPEKRYGVISPGRQCSPAANGMLWTAHAMGYTDAYPDFNQLLLFRTDPTGQVLQRRFYFNPSEAIANGILAMDDGGALVYGSLGTAVSDGFLMQLDPQGQVVWSKRYKSLIFLRDGGRFAGGDLLLTAQHGKDFAFARIKTNGDMVWAKALGDSISLFQTCIGADQQIVFSARRTGAPAFLFKVEQTGDAVLWARAFETCTHYPIAALGAAPDGGYFLTQNTVSGTPASRLLKVSAAGELAPGCPVLSVAKPAFTPLSVSTEMIAWTLKETPLEDRRSLFGSEEAMVDVYDCCPSDAPTARFSIPDSVCVLFPLQVAADLEGCEEGWEWEVQGNALQGAVLQDVVFEQEGVFPIILRAYNGDCEDQAVDSIRVVAAPSGQLFAGADTVVCPDKPLVITPVQGNFDRWIWFDSLHTAVRVFDPPQAGRYVLTAQRGLCSITDTLELILGNCGPDKLYAPNAFSPNDDGDNDFWELFPGPGITPLLCIIYDRWGNLCFQSASGETPRWDGFYNGKPVAPGVLVWTFRYKNIFGEEKNAKGSLLLLR